MSQITLPTLTIGKKTLFSFLLGLDVLANILELTHVNFFFISTLISFFTCLVLPGLLISLILRIKKISFWENLLIIVGLSIAFLEFGGLLLNILLPLFRINDPLAFYNLVIGFDIYTLLLFILAWIRTKQFEIQIQLPRRSRTEKALYALPVFFPILATLGAIVLNNGGSGTLTLILLGTIAFYSLLLVLLRDKIPADLFPYALFFIGIACLFTTSLRSWYISGHDITIEYYVFKLTNEHHIWNMSFFQDAYNACLSITILPTILTNLLSIQDIYVYKVIFQVIFAASPILVFFIVRNYISPVFAFLTAFLFLSFPTFFSDMPWINRQEIGLIFFGLALYMMLKYTEPQQPYTEFDTLSTLRLKLRRLLFVIFALSVIVSHYSTNFVLLALLAFVFISRLIISLPFVKRTYALLLSRSRIKPKNTFPDQKFLSLPMLLPLVVLFLFFMTYVWDNLYTNTSNHAGSVIAEVVGSIFVQSGTRSSDISYSIFFHPPKKDSKQLFQDYIKSVEQRERSINPEYANPNQLYGKPITDKYPVSPLSQEQLSPTPYGTLLSSFGISVFDGQAALRSFSASILQIFVFIGLLALFFFKAKQTFDLDYVFLCFGALLLLALITVLPNLSLEYGVLRMFQQLLFVLSLPIVLGLSSILFFVKEPRRILVIGVTVIVFFLNLAGFISHLTGEYYPQMTLDNAGPYYDFYYVRGSDVHAIIWLSKDNVNHEPVQTDQAGTNKLLTYSIHAIEGDFPVVILKDAYVYFKASPYIAVEVENGSTLYFSSPKSFLDDHKNLIYSNGEDSIYK